MALILADRVRETTPTTGTGTLTLTGPFSGFRAFSAIGDGNTTYYAIADANTGEWEVGVGTYSTSGNTLSRDTVLDSSNTGSLVVFAAGAKDVICTQPAERAVYLEAAGTSTIVPGITISGLTASTALALDASKDIVSVTNTGSGSNVLATSPTLVTPALGTPSALVGTNITGTAAGLTAGNVTTNANLTGAVTSVGNATSLGSFNSTSLRIALTDETGTGSVVFATCPTLVTPALGTPTSATLTNAVGLPIDGGTINTLPVTRGGSGVTTSTGTGSVVLNTSPSLVTPALGTPSSGVVTNLTGTASINVNGTVGATTPAAGAFTTLSASGTTTLSSLTASTALALNGGSQVVSVTNTGSGSNVLATSPTLVTPALGTPSSATLTNATGLPIVAGTTGTLTVLRGGTGVTTSTGSGNVVLSTSPTLVTPALGTPSALVGTNITGTAAGLTAGNVTTNANLTGAVTSVGNATSLGSFSSANLAAALTDETGTGSVVFATSPTLVTPALGTPSSLTLTNATDLPVTGGGTGVATLTDKGVLFGNGTAAVGITDVGTATHVLTSNGAGLAPTFQAAGGGGTALELYAENPVTPTAPSATGDNAVAIGMGTQSTGINSVALGQAYASGADSFAAAIASSAATYGATGANSIAMGKLAKATQVNSIAIGNSANSLGHSGIAIGYQAHASGLGGIAIGNHYYLGTPTASGGSSIAIGDEAKATQKFSTALGASSSSVLIGKYAYAGGEISGHGDSQTGTFVLRSDTTDATPEALTTNNSTAGTTDQIILPNNSAHAFHGTIIARQQAATGSDYASWEIKGALLRDGSAATTVLGNGIQDKLYATAGASAWAITLTADTTNGGLKIEVTGATATNIRWVATVNTSEVGYT